MKKVFALITLLIITPMVAWSLIAVYLSFTEAVNNQFFSDNGLIWIGEASEVIEDETNNITATKFTILEVWCGEVRMEVEDAPDYIDSFPNTESEIWLISNNYNSDFGYPLDSPILIASFWNGFSYSTGQYAEDWLPIDGSNNTVTGFIHLEPISETMTLTDLAAELSLEHCASTGTGINDALLLATTLFPNPTENMLQVVFESAEELAVSIYNANGALVLQQSGLLETTELDVSNLTTGMYFLALSQNGIIVRSDRFMKK